MSIYSGSILFSCSSKAPLSRDLPWLGSSESYELKEEGGDDSGGVGKEAGDERGYCSGEGDGDREREGNKEEDCGKDGPGGECNEDSSFDISAVRSTSLSGIFNEVERSWICLALDRVL
ncbi:hypothetical protein M0802_016192 [Mischocyttarus mexicanus]|nr:hypothetical protein M0802_016198 [Mischocyttarus mexicanus]KAI4473294.1 hypothetical protein M0802_016192 [Mischocyttarus mexicanus]